jgi:adenosylhomocysteinase
MCPSITKKTLWQDSPFPELYEKHLSTPLCEDLAKKNEKISLIIIHHLHEAGLIFIRALAKKYKIHKIIGIPYSSIDEMVNDLKADFDVTVPEKLSDIPSLVKQAVLSAKTNVIIEEIGAYTVDIVDFLDKQDNVLGIVEDTHQGHWRWQKVNLNRLPILSVAYSKIKRIEDNFVAKSIIDGYEYFLKRNNHLLLSKQKVLVVGFGNIGQQLAKYLSPLVKDLAVFDKDPIKLLKASIDYKVVKSFLGFDTIIGVTGDPEHAIGQNELKHVSTGTFLVSGSSKRVEFDLLGFARLSNHIKKHGDYEEYKFDDKAIIVVNAGEPINFRYSVIPSKMLDLVYGGLTYCIDKLSNGFNQSGLHNLNNQEEQEIVARYNKIYKII